MEPRKPDVISRHLGKTGWFYVGSVCSAGIAVILAKIAYNQIEWEWSALRADAMVLFIISVIVTIGPFAAFDLSERATRLLDSSLKPGAAFYFWAGAVYPFALLLSALPAGLINSHLVMLLFMIFLLAWAFLMPWSFVRYLAKRVERMNRQG